MNDSLWLLLSFAEFDQEDLEREDVGLDFPEQLQCLCDQRFHQPRAK